MKKIIYYIDFDGVILDTYPVVFEEKLKIPGNENWSRKEFINYFSKINWYETLKKCPEINGAFSVLKKLRKDKVFILTKCGYYEVECEAKRKILKDNEVDLEVISVAFEESKSSAVNPVGNILIDDTIRNCKDWENYKGKAIFFDTNNNQIDEWNELNTSFKSVNSLNFLLEIPELVNKK